jgi:hypothetical protein
MTDDENAGDKGPTAWPTAPGYDPWPAGPDAAYPAEPDGAYPAEPDGAYPAEPDGAYPAEPDGAYPFEEPDTLERTTVPQPVSVPPWRKVPRPPVWSGRPREQATGSIGPASGSIDFAVGRVGVATTAEQRLHLDLSGPAHPGGGGDRTGPAGPPPDQPHGPGYSHGPRWAGRAWLALAAVAILVLTVSAGLALSPRSVKGRTVAATAGPATAARQPAPVADPPAGPTGAAGTTGSPGATAQPTPPQSMAPQSMAPQSMAPAAPGPVITTYEAEAAANTLSGGAFVATYQGASGGRVVKNLGDWKTKSGPGSLTFTNVTVPVTGTYTLIFYYVFVNGDPTRTAVITVSGADPIDVTAAGGSVCCARQAVAVNLTAGRNTITFGNPHATAPAIDKIEIVKGTAG